MRKYKIALAGLVVAICGVSFCSNPPPKYQPPTQTHDPQKSRDAGNIKRACNLYLQRMKNKTPKGSIAIFRSTSQPQIVGVEFQLAYYKYLSNRLANKSVTAERSLFNTPLKFYPPHARAPPNIIT